MAIPRTPVEKYKPEAKMAMKTAFNKALDKKRSHIDCRRKYAEVQDSLLSSLGILGEYFRKSSYDRGWSFEDVDTVAHRVYGNAGREVMNYVHTRNNSKEKRARDYAILSKPVDWSESPFTTLDSCVKAAHEVLKFRKEYQVSHEETQVKMSELTAPFVEAPNRKNLSVLGNLRQEKSSNIFTSIVGSSIAKKMSTPAGNEPSPVEERVHRELTDPDHLNELRAIKAKAQLYDYLRNDEIISGYDPDEVLKAYNEIAAMNPRSSTQPAIMRPLLRKRLTAGAIEPYEAKEMADIEKTLAQTEAMESNKQLAKESDVLNKSRILDQR
jgi:hypothetical protein